MSDGSDSLFLMIFLRYTLIVLRRKDDNAYLLARTIQFFTPGIPQVYYVGLLAGKNDIELLERTKEWKTLNY